MQSHYLDEYVEDRKLRTTLSLTRNTVVFKSKVNNPLSFCLIFFRLADRCLYHSSNVWSQFVTTLKMLEHHRGFLEGMSEDARTQTSDLSTKYEIEAYLAAAKALFEDNLLGDSNPKNGGPRRRRSRDLLGVDFTSDPKTLHRLQKSFTARKKAFFREANKIRNHAYHVNPQLRDPGVQLWVKKVNRRFAVTLPNVFTDDKGNSVDLVEVFAATHQYIRPLITEVRDTLLDYFIQRNGPLSHGTYDAIQSPYGTMVVGIVPEGFYFSPFHETPKSK